MNILHVLDQESRRIERDFRHCMSASDRGERRRLGHAWAERVAAYLLALEHALFPALAGLDDYVLRALRDDHGELKARVAEALLAYCGAERRAFCSLCKAYVRLRRHVWLLHRQLDPLLQRAVSPGQQALIGEDLMRWLETNRREPVVLSVARPAGRTPARKLPPTVDLSRIPTLFHEIPPPLPMTA